MIRIQFVMIIIVVGLLCACSSVMPESLSQQAVDLPFQALVDQGGNAIGQTVIMGGYVLKVDNTKAYTRLEVVQAPLGYNQKPKSKDLSQGRLIIKYAGFLDPEVYSRDRQITVGGNITGSTTTGPSDHPYPFLNLQAEKIHLWPVEPPPREVDPWRDDWFFPWYGYPPFWHPPHRHH